MLRVFIGGHHYRIIEGGFPMSVCRLALITFSLMLLVACGGGGSSGTTATGTPTTMGDPPADLPGYAITDSAAARTATGGTEITMTEMEIVTEIQNRANAANIFEFSDFAGTADVDVTCRSIFCAGDVPNIGIIAFSLSGIKDLSLVQDAYLVGFNSESQVVMEDSGVTMIQSQAAAGQEDGTQFSFQTYGGWITNSVFGVELLDVTEGNTTTNRFASFSFGNASGSNPTRAALVRYVGIMAGVDTRTGGIIQGDAIASLKVGNPNILDSVHFQSMVSLDAGTSAPSGIITFMDIPLADDGTFESSNGDIKGSFYGADHEGIGGIFDRDNILGAFGVTRR